MTLKPKVGAFLAFTAVFAVFAGFVFWGTWSTSVAPVMPDTWITHPTDTFHRFWVKWLATGRFIPSDLINLVGSPFFWQELKFVLATYLAALGVAYYARGRGLPPLAGYGAGLLLAFCGYWLTLFSAGHLGWFFWMMYGVFAFGLADRAVRTNRLKYWLLLGADIAWASFNQQDLWLLFTCFTAGYFAWCCVRERKLPWKGALVSALVFVAIGLPNFIETLTTTLKGRQQQIAQGENISTAKQATADGTGEANERARRWEFVTNWSLPSDELVEWVVPRVNGDTSCPFVQSIGPRHGRDVKPYTGALGRPLNATRGNYRQHSVYVGFAILLLALIGLKGGGKGDAWFFAGAALLFALLSLGRYCAPLYRVIFILPFGDLIRCPVKWHHLTELSLAFLAAFGLARVLTWRIPRISLLAGIFVLLGAANLAWEAHRFCAPVDIRAAKAHGLKQELTILQKRDFANPQVAAMVKSGQIISLANYCGNPDVYVVGVLTPFESEDRPASGRSIALGVLSLLVSCGVIVCGVKKS